MKAALMMPTVVVATWLFVGGPDPEKVLKDAAQSMQDVAAVLKTVRDKQSAEAAVSKLDEPINRLLSTMEAVKKIRPDDPAVAKLMEKYDRLGKEAQKNMEQEADRILKQPDLLKFLQKSQVWLKLEMVLPFGPMNRARMDIKSLETAVCIYLTKHGNYPQTLDQLLVRDPVDGSPALLTEKPLTDPWDQRYIYDPRALHPQTGKPLIYSNGPPGLQRRISNRELDVLPAKK